MRMFAKFFVLAWLWVAAPDVQAQADAAVAGCISATSKARGLMVAFYRSGKRDFPAFVDEQRKNTEAFAGDARRAKSGILGFVVGSGAGFIATKNFDLAVGILVGLDLYDNLPQEKTRGKWSGKVTTKNLEKLDKYGLDYCYDNVSDLYRPIP